MTDEVERVARAIKDEIGSQLCFGITLGGASKKRNCEKWCPCRDAARAAIAALREREPEPVAWPTVPTREEVAATVSFRPTVDKDAPDAHNVYFKVGVQEFRITPYSCETREDAEWMKEMFVRAVLALFTGADR